MSNRLTDVLFHYWFPPLLMLTVISVLVYLYYSGCDYDKMISSKLHDRSLTEDNVSSERKESWSGVQASVCRQDTAAWLTSSSMCLTCYSHTHCWHTSLLAPPTLLSSLLPSLFLSSLLILFYSRLFYNMTLPYGYFPSDS